MQAMHGSAQRPFTPTVAIGPDTRDSLGAPYRPLRWFSSDGLLLAGRRYGPDHPMRPPVLCLPGLTRNARDFDAIAGCLASAGLWVLVMDSRGRGQSQWDADPQRYTAWHEMLDALGLIDALALAHISVLGTSRGGILAMLMARHRPGLIARTVMNDIGPRIELAGLFKIKGYVGRAVGERDWPSAVAALRAGQASQFPRLDEAGWERYARRLWRDVDGRPVIDYDPALSLGLAGLTPETELPDMWDAFAALAKTPVLVLRGALSDLLSPATTTDMARRHDTVTLHEVPDEGHAPFIEDEPTMRAVRDFLT